MLGLAALLLLEARQLLRAKLGRWRELARAPSALLLARMPAQEIALQPHDEVVIIDGRFLLSTNVMLERHATLHECTRHFARAEHGL